MSARGAKEKIIQDIVDQLSATSDPAHVSAILAQAKEYGINQRTLHRWSGGRQVLADRRFSESQGRYRKTEVMPPAEDTAEAAGLDQLAVYALQSLMVAHGYQTQSDKRHKHYVYPHEHILPDAELKAAMHSAQSPVKRAHVLRHSLTCTQAILGVAGLPAWGPVDSEPTPAVKGAAQVLHRPMRATQQPQFHELPAPSWSYLEAAVGNVALAPMALRTDTLLATTHPTETLIYPTRQDGTKKLGRAEVRRRFVIERHRYWIADPELAIITPESDDLRPDGTLPLAVDSITELSELGKLSDPAVNELARPLADVIVARHTLLMASG